MLQLYNEYLTFLPRLKKFFGKSGRGPEAVFSSLVQGLDELKVEYRVNQKSLFAVDIVCVLSGTGTLKWAIKQKRLGNIKIIIAGPNISVTPNDEADILKSEDINTIIVPSQWVKDFYISLAPKLASKIYVWAAGVSLPVATSVNKDFDFLIYDKIPKGSTLASGISHYLTEQKFRIKTVTYGSFKVGEYFGALEKSRYLIYLSESESQGLAMFEAWVRNVPTLVWDRGFLQYKNYRWEGNTATPYLTPLTGSAFKNFDDFKRILLEFQHQKFSPGEWVKNNATNKIAARKYLEIVNL